MRVVELSRLREIPPEWSRLVPAQREEWAPGHAHRVLATSNYGLTALLTVHGLLPGGSVSNVLGAFSLIEVLALASGKSGFKYLQEHSLLELLRDDRRDGKQSLAEPLMRLAALLGNCGYVDVQRIAKLCPTCVASDLASKGFYWFRRFHQIAGLDWCPVHKVAMDIHKFDIRSGPGPIDDASQDGFLGDHQAAPPAVRAYHEIMCWIGPWSRPSAKTIVSQLLADVAGPPASASEQTKQEFALECLRRDKDTARWMEVQFKVSGRAITDYWYSVPREFRAMNQRMMPKEHRRRSFLPRALCAAYHLRNVPDLVDLLNTREDDFYRDIQPIFLSAEQIQRIRLHYKNQPLI